MPDISAYTTPLSGCVRNSCPFKWTPLLDKCFESIKALACRAPILKPINSNNPNPIWVITNNSKARVGAVYGQGPDWKTCRPARFLSKKFSNAHQHYRTHDHKTIPMLKALMKWEDRLLGHKFSLVTDHKGLEYFETLASEYHIWSKFSMSLWYTHALKSKRSLIYRGSVGYGWNGLGRRRRSSLTQIPLLCLLCSLVWIWIDKLEGCNT